MNPEFSFNGMKFTAVDVSGAVALAREGFASFYKVHGGEDAAVLEVLDDVVYESPRLDEAEIAALTLLWADLIARQLQLHWFSVSIDGRESRVIAAVEPVVYVIFPEQRVREMLAQGGASFGSLHAAVLLEMLLAANSTRLQEQARQLLRQNEYVMGKLSPLVAGGKADSADSGPV